MPGSTLSLSYPVIGDPIATALAKIIAILQALQNDIQPKIVPAEFDWITDLSAQGHSLTHLSALQFDPGVFTSVPIGTLLVDGNYDLYIITGAGAVQLTAGGSINAASIGGIFGDYGGSFPARVTFDSSSNQYRFTKDVGIWADLVMNNAVLEALTGGGSVRLKADDALAFARTFTFKDQPASGNSVLTIDSSGNISPGSVNAVTNSQTFTSSVTVTGGLNVSTTKLAATANVSLEGTADLKHAAQWELPQVAALIAGAVGGSFTVNSSGQIVPPAGLAQRIDLGATGLRVGDIIQQATLRVKSVDAGTTHYQMFRWVDGVAGALSNDVTSAFGDGAWHTVTVTFASPWTVAAGDAIVLRWTPPASTNNDRFERWSCFVTH